MRKTALPRPTFNAKRYLIMRLGRHGGTKFSVPVSINVDQIKYPPGSRTCAEQNKPTQIID